jgi:hypothetical protein
MDSMKNMTKMNIFDTLKTYTLLGQFSKSTGKSMNGNKNSLMKIT